nr:radical SAM protein [Cyanobacteria bacterium UBA8530]
AFGRKENKMELFHNQITKAQGIASVRSLYRSNSLYFLAENVSCPVTVLDFPSRKRFIRELRENKYDAVGISFITPNFLKAREMARLVREIRPEAEIILGGHGAAIENIEESIPCDHVVKGEGIGWLRKYLGEDSSKPIVHPLLPTAEFRMTFGIPSGSYYRRKGSKGKSLGAMLVPGVGCVNGCRFCATSHFFGKAYTSFFPDGESLFREMCRLGDALNTNEIAVQDENFLKDRQRALDLLECLEKGKRPFCLNIFSSAEAIAAFGVENMARLGVVSVWIGAESKLDAYEKNQGRDLKALIQELHRFGIRVIVSGILFVEHHDKKTIQDDIDYLIDLEGDFTQFMQLIPFPVTALYEDYKAKGWLDFDLPYEDWHGQDKLIFTPPHFSRAEAREILDQAFKSEFDRLSSSMYRLSSTTLKGAKTLTAYPTDPWMAIRRDQLRAQSKLLRALIPTLRRNAHNPLERDRIEQLNQDYFEVLGKTPISTRALGFAAVLLSEAFKWRIRFFGDRLQPRTIHQKYRQ